MEPDCLLQLCPSTQPNILQLKNKNPVIDVFCVGFEKFQNIQSGYKSPLRYIFSFKFAFT